MTTSWDERHRQRTPKLAPSPLLVQAVEHVAPGSALDVACGMGRNSLYLAHRGWKVTAVDASQVAIGALLGEAFERGVSVQTQVADLENNYAISPESFDLICAILYLQRDLIPAIRAAIRPGGMFVGEWLLTGSFAAKRGELHELFGDWKIVHYAEIERAEIIAVKPSPSVETQISSPPHR